MTNGKPSRGEIATLKKALKIAQDVSEWQRTHPKTLNAGLHYVSSDAARALDTLINMLQD